MLIIDPLQIPFRVAPPGHAFFLPRGKMSDESKIDRQISQLENVAMELRIAAYKFEKGVQSNQDEYHVRKIFTCFLALVGLCACIKYIVR